MMYTILATFMQFYSCNLFTHQRIKKFSIHYTQLSIIMNKMSDFSGFRVNYVKTTD